MGNLRCYVRNCCKFDLQSQGKKHQIFPKKLKEANVMPPFKKGDPLNVIKYRSISANKAFSIKNSNHFSIEAITKTEGNLILSFGKNLIEIYLTNWHQRVRANDIYSSSY